MPQERADAALSDDELAGVTAEPLPDRKAMSTIGCDPSEFDGVVDLELTPPADETTDDGPDAGPPYAADQ